MAEYEERLMLGHDAIPQSGLYPLIRGIDKTIRELNDEVYDFRRSSDDKFSRMEEDISGIKKDMVDIKITTGVTQSELSSLKEDVKEIRRDVSELKGTLKELTGSFTAMQARFNWGLVILGIIIALLQFWKR